MKNFNIEEQLNDENNSGIATIHDFGRGSTPIVIYN